MEIKGTENLLKIDLVVINPEVIYKITPKVLERINYLIDTEKEASKKYKRYNSFISIKDDDMSYQIFVSRVPKNKVIRKLFPFRLHKLYKQLAEPEWEILHRLNITLQGLFMLRKVDEAVITMNYSPIMNSLIKILLETIFTIDQCFYDPDSGEMIMHVHQAFDKSPELLTDCEIYHMEV